MSRLDICSLVGYVECRLTIYCILTAVSHTEVSGYFNLLLLAEAYVSSLYAPVLFLCSFRDRVLLHIA